MTNDSRYSVHARRALVHARRLAAQLRHAQVDTGHLLVGVLCTEGSIGWRVLDEMSLSAAQAEPHLRSLHPEAQAVENEPPFAEALNQTLELAASESAWLSHHYIGTEHLLLGLTRTNAGSASALLRRLGLTPEQVRSRVRRALTEGASELDVQTAKHTLRLSELSRRVITAAEQLAVTLDHPTVGIGHLLVVLAQETRSPTARLLRDSGLQLEQLRADLTAGDPALRAGIEPVLNRVLELVEALGSHYTGTEHLLLSLVYNETGSAALRTYGADVDFLAQVLGRA